MLNPWLSFSLKATRLGWETQSMVVDQLMAMAGVNAADRHGARDASPIDSPEGEPAAAAAPTSAEAQTVTPVHAIKDDKPGKVAQPVSNGHKKQDRGNKQRRSR